MTYSEYQQLRDYSSRLILEHRAKLLPKGGNRVSVFGQSISISPRRVEEEPEPPPTFLAIFQEVRARITGKDVAGDTIDEPFFYPMSLVAVVANGEILESNAITGPTQLFDFPEGEAGSFRRRTIDVDYHVRTAVGNALAAWPNYPAKLEDGAFRQAVRLTLSQVDESGTIVNNQSLRVGSNGNSKRFVADRSNQLLYVKITGIVGL